jgi:hypothetical protein
MNSKFLTAMALALSCVGCTAEADLNVSKYAALDLQAAKGEMQTAEAAAVKHDEAGIEPAGRGWALTQGPKPLLRRVAQWAAE